MIQQPGQQFLHYSLIEKIGEGGMGVVWKAKDTKLDRQVAIKFLPQAFATDSGRMARFEREAKLLASLHHPNIASIFGFETAPESTFLVMELVEGEDLAALLRNGALPVEEALDIARQIAEGLDKAHEKGIVHRDLKPANVKLTPDGTVKVLDFGLARAYAGQTAVEESLSSAPTMTAPISQAGVVLGTAAYMSPEQARGKHVDRRADVWAFGCVLYEMLTGKRCFGGDTATDVLANIVTKEPDWNPLPPALPRRVKELLQQALEKDPRQRLRDMGDIGLVIEKAGTDAVAPSPQVVTARRSSRPYIWGAMLVILAAIVVGAITWPWTSRPEPANLLYGATFTRITDSAGSETSAAISHDGKNIAYLSDRNGRFDVYVIPVGTGQPYNLTNGLVGGLNSMLRSVGFTPDGSELWLPGTLWGRLRRMPLHGGTPRNWLGSHAANVSWSPDGNRIVLTTWDPGDPLIVADDDGSDRREIINSGTGYHQHFPIWGPDGWIYMVRGQEITREMDLWRIRPDGSGSERLITGTRDPTFPTPIDEKSLLFIAQEQDGAGPWLWSLDLESRSVRRLSFGLEQYTSIAASADGRRLVASVANPRVSLWQVPIRDKPATESDAAPFELPTVRALAPRFGPEELFYLSSRGGGDGLWRFRNGTSSEIWKGTETPLLEPVAVSPDGASVALLLRQKKRNVLHVLSADGAVLRALSSAVDVRGSVSWSPDGAWIVAGGKDSDGNPGLFKVSVGGDQVEKIVEGQAFNPIWSPAGKLIVYDGPQVNAVCPVLGVRPDGIPVELPPLEILARGQRLRFLPDGRGLIHMVTSTNFHQDFWLLDLSTMKDRQLTRLDDAGTISTFDITPDGKRIVFDRLRANADIVLIELADD
jgi:serine/threonine protein kinase/Tol biopolymer transport system component